MDLDHHNRIIDIINTAQEFWQPKTNKIFQYLAMLDIIFLIDASTSVQMVNFGKILLFVKSVSDGFTYGFHETRIGVIKFGEDARILFGFYCCSDLKAFDKTVELQILSYKPPAKPKNTPAGTIGKGLQLAWYMFNGPTGRRHVAQVLVIVTSVTSADDIMTPSQHLRNAGVEIFTIGVGNDFSQSEVLEMSSLPTFLHIFHVKDFGDLGKRAQLIIDRIVRSKYRQLIIFDTLIVQVVQNVPHRA
jgi:collagen type XXI alpha